MVYRKLTKKQWKNRERVLAWLEGKEFKENARANPAGPDLSVGEVLEFYAPPDVTGSAQYFTPAEMSESLVSYMNIPLYDDDVRILDPCAGIGHLLWPLLRADNHLDLVAYEIEEECVKIGRRLFPRIDWNWKIPFDHLAEIEGCFDFVVMNPPFNVTRGMAPGWEMCEGRCTKSEHVFLELAVRACKPEGVIGVIAPWNFWKRLPKKLLVWLEDKLVLEREMGQLSGKFEMSNVTVHGYIFRRTDEVLAWVQEVNRKVVEIQDDLCSTTHPTAWHEDPDIVKGKKEWKELAAVQNGLSEDVQPEVGGLRRVVATQLTLFNSHPVFGEIPARARPQAMLLEGAPLRLCIQDTDGKPREG